MNASRGLPYRTAYGHARAIVDASKYLMGGNTWSAEDVPAEVPEMIEAIARKMRATDPALLRLIGLAVDDVLEEREPRW